MPPSRQLSEPPAASRRTGWFIAGLIVLGLLLLSTLAMVGYRQFRELAHSAPVMALEGAPARATIFVVAPAVTWPAPSATSTPAAAAAARPPTATGTLAVAPDPTATLTPGASRAATAPTILPADVPVCGRAVVLGVSALNMRREPAITAPVVATVPQFESVEWFCTEPVQANQRAWRHVRYRGWVGWMSDRFLDLQPAQISVATPIPAASATPGSAPGVFVYTFPVRGARVSYGPSHHDYPATDIFAPPGSLFVAPTSGWIEFVNPVDRWDPATDVPADRGGVMLSLIGDDGVRYYGSHLQAIAQGIEVGARVEVGQLLGYTGSSGNATGTPPHLHFGISRPTTPDDWRTRRGELAPYPYLKAWERGEMVTPDLSRLGR